MRANVCLEERKERERETEGKACLCVRVQECASHVRVCGVPHIG